MLVAASALVGHAINLLGARCRAAAPAVGLSVLVIVAYGALRLPGRATTAVVAVAVVIVAAAALVVIRTRGARRRRERREPGDRRAVAVPIATAVTIGLAAFGAAIPFIANGRVGLLGVSFDNDTAPHLVWAQALQQPVVGDRYGLNLGYPLGPHSLADVIARGFGVRLDLAFTALLIAAVIITAIVAASALRGEAAWKRPVVGVLAALFYLVAAYYGEGAFKEPLMGLLLLAMVLQFEEISDLWTAPGRARLPALLPVAVIVAAGVYIYSYLAFAWFGLTLAIWLVAELLSRPRMLRSLRPARAVARLREHGAALIDQIVPLAVAVVVMVVLLVPIAGRVISYVQSLGLSPAGTGAITASNLGNLAHPLSAYEALGIWQSPDFRFLGANIFHQGELSALALGVLVLGLVRCLGRRELLLPAAVVACAIIFWHSNQGQSPYVTAKALVIAGPVVAVTGLRGVLRAETIPVTPWAKLGRWLLAVAFVGLAVHSSYQALRNEPVWPNESTKELISLDKVTSGQPLLFLGQLRLRAVAVPRLGDERAGQQHDLAGARRPRARRSRSCMAPRLISTPSTRRRSTGSGG